MALASGVTLLIALANVAMLALMLSVRPHTRNAHSPGARRRHGPLAQADPDPKRVLCSLALLPGLWWPRRSIRIVSTDALGIPRRDAIRMMEWGWGSDGIGIAADDGRPHRHARHGSRKVGDAEPGQE